jgi:hypothetical protein
MVKEDKFITLIMPLSLWYNVKKKVVNEL